MKKVFSVLVLAVFLAAPLYAFGAEVETTLTLKRDLVQERITRIQAQLELMRVKYAQGQQNLTILKKQLQDLEQQIRIQETPKPEEDAPE